MEWLQCRCLINTLVIESFSLAESPSQFQGQAAWSANRPVPYRVFLPGRSNAPLPSEAVHVTPGIHLLTNVAFFRGKAKVFESSLVELTELNARDRKAGVFQFDLPLSPLRPGFYTCQVMSSMTLPAFSFSRGLCC
jgi:hypothetical protein